MLTSVVMFQKLQKALQFSQRVPNNTWGPSVYVYENIGDI